MSNTNSTNSGNSAIGFIASVVVTAMLIGGVVYVFNFFKGAQQAIIARDVTVLVLSVGEGAGAREGDTVLVNYIGKLENGVEFDNSYKRKQPFTVIIGEGRVILGWEKGLLGIKKGEKRQLTIPPALAYGSVGVPDPSGSGDYIIPPDATLVFEIEALEIGTHGYFK